MIKPGAQRLRDQLARNHSIAQRVQETDFPLAQFNGLQQWQRARIARSFEDLAQRKGYRPAVQFFLNGVVRRPGFPSTRSGHGARHAGDDPVPAGPDAGNHGGSFRAAGHQPGVRYGDGLGNGAAEAWIASICRRYCDVYRAADDRAGRERQILLIRKLGYDLDRLVRWPLVNYLVRLIARSGARGRVWQSAGVPGERAGRIQGARGYRLASSKRSMRGNGVQWKGCLPVPSSRSGSRSATGPRQRCSRNGLAGNA